jgi:hypothetical protein
MYVCIKHLSWSTQILRLRFLMLRYQIYSDLFCNSDIAYVVFNLPIYSYLFYSNVCTFNDVLYESNSIPILSTVFYLLLLTSFQPLLQILKSYSLPQNACPFFIVPLLLYLYHTYARPYP